MDSHYNSLKFKLYLAVWESSMTSTEREKWCGFVWAGEGSGTADTLAVMESIPSQNQAAINSSAAPRTSPQLDSALCRHLPFVVLFCSLVGNPCTTLVLQDLRSKPAECKFQPFLLFLRAWQCHCFDLSRDKMLLFLQQGADVCKLSSFWNLWMQNICLEGSEKLRMR